MTRILRSIALRFPLLLAAIVLSVALVTGQLARREIGEVLLADAHAELETGATQVAVMLSGTVRTVSVTLAEIAVVPEIRQAFGRGVSDAEARRRLEQHVLGRQSTTRVGARLLNTDGTTRATVGSAPEPSGIDWSVGAIREGTLRSDSATFGPIVAIADTLAGYTAVVPVRREGGELLGWLEDVHSARGRGADDVRALISVQRLLLGSRNRTVWTDLESIVAGPALVAPMDSLQAVVGADGATALGLARGVAGAPWVVWVDRPETVVMAPIEHFLRRMWFATLVIAAVGAALAWTLGRVMAARIRVVAGELDRTLTSHGNRPASHHGHTDELRVLEEAYAALESRVEQRQKLDAQHLQAQKLEAVGRLAGGIAHDFNNLLTVISSYAEMVRESVPSNSPAADDIGEVLKASERATALTRQLLTFSRQHIGDARPIDVNEVVRNMDRMLSRLIPSNVERVVELASAAAVHADSNQLEQVLINLVVNAVDAMPEGGRLTIRTGTERPDDALELEGDGAGARNYVCVCVTDTGIGMDADTLARIFDPFFTTKSLGKGTGLGLATAHGIVREAGGRIVASSEPGAGTTMRVYLPVVEDAARPAGRPSLPITAPPLAPGLVLVAEDDAATRAVITRILQSVGHAVQECETADAALEWMQTHGATSTPMAVISDVMMPGMSGVGFLSVLRELHPEMPVVLISGYADIGERVPDDLRMRPVILEKPFTSAALHTALRRAMQTRAS